ncbi:uncharacterized protein BJ171DRAFT_175427, partial [Polychytrium aggregatum]|uniref:uncharacterized protein n=1 Tax=Polychytrium aggregatum TaxID=110093 RepID=UPI0022FEF70B
SEPIASEPIASEPIAPDRIELHRIGLFQKTLAESTSTSALPHFRTPHHSRHIHAPHQHTSAMLFPRLQPTTGFSVLKPVSRWFKPHYESRTVVVSENGNPNAAYSNFKNLIRTLKIRETVKYQERFERNHDKGRRIRKQKEWDKYIEYARKQVQLAIQLKVRTKIEKKNYDHI